MLYAMQNFIRLGFRLLCLDPVSMLLQAVRISALLKNEIKAFFGYWHLHASEKKRKSNWDFIHFVFTFMYINLQGDAL